MCVPCPPPSPGEKRQEITAQRGQQVVMLSDYDRDRLEDMLRGLTAERSAIAEVGEASRRACKQGHMLLWTQLSACCVKAA